MTPQPQMLAAALRGSGAMQQADMGQRAGGAGSFLGGGAPGSQFAGFNRQMYPMAQPMRGMPNRNTGMFLGAGGQFSSGFPQSAY